MQANGVSHEFIEISLAIGSFLLMVIDGLQFYILHDIRDRLARLEEKEMRIIRP